MELLKKIETKFNEVIVRTSSLEEMKGMYLAERLLRSWNEDFVDEDTSEVVSIERNEILFDKGALLDNDNLAEVNFYLQSGDIKDVLVSNQKRTGTSVKSQASVYAATVLSGNKKKNYYLYSDSIDLAHKIMTDFLEQKLEGSFSFTSIKELGYSTLIPAEEEDADKDVYKVEIELIYDGDDEVKRVYMLKAGDAEEAKDLIIKFISLKMKDDNDDRTFETTILSAQTIPCNNIIDYHFVKEYFDNEKS